MKRIYSFIDYFTTHRWLRFNVNAETSSPSLSRDKVKQSEKRYRHRGIVINVYHESTSICWKHPTNYTCKTMANAASTLWTYKSNNMSPGSQSERLLVPDKNLLLHDPSLPSLPWCKRPLRPPPPTLSFLFILFLYFSLSLSLTVSFYMPLLYMCERTYIVYIYILGVPEIHICCTCTTYILCRYASHPSYHETKETVFLLSNVLYSPLKWCDIL